MEAGLPLLAISILAFCVLLSWQFGGSGLRSRRAVVATVIGSGLLACWVLLLSFGAFHWAGAIAIGTGFALSIVALLVPWVWRRLPQFLSGAGSAAQQGTPADVLAAASRRQRRG